MKVSTIFSTLLVGTVLLFTSCTPEEEVLKEGSLQLIFDNRVGNTEIAITSDTDTNFPYTSPMNQMFNITKLGYYVSRVELTGPNGESYVDKVTTGPMDEDVNGFYHVQEKDVNSQLVTLENVPSGTYDELTFTLGVEADAVQQGATGGPLDPANGGWLWNWDAGYIGWAMEGRSPSSPAVAGPLNQANSVKLHIGGWKEIAGNTAMTNNVKRITLKFPSSVEVGEGLTPSAHLHMDLLVALGAHASGHSGHGGSHMHHQVDFSAEYSVHSPAAGKDIGENLEGAFEVHHVHQ
jgi:hypothetical protein